MTRKSFLALLSGIAAWFAVKPKSLPPAAKLSEDEWLRILNKARAKAQAEWPSHGVFFATNPSMIVFERSDS